MPKVIVVKDIQSSDIEYVAIALAFTPRVVWRYTNIPSCNAWNTELLTDHVDAHVIVASSVVGTVVASHLFDPINNDVVFDRIVYCLVADK